LKQTQVDSLVEDLPISLQVESTEESEPFERVSVGPAEPRARIVARLEAKDGTVYVLDAPLEV
jgi:hypothetical protein